MVSRLPKPLTALVGLLITAAPLSAQGAFSSQSWTMCTPGEFNSCGKFVVETDAIRVAEVRTGTAVNVRVTNLQGAFASDNTLYSFFNSVLFLGHFAGMAPTPGPQPITPSLAGSSPETDSWRWETGPITGASGVMSMLTLYSPSFRSTIAGCDFVDPEYGPSHPSIYTCGEGVAASFTFDTGSLFDASEFETVRFDTQGVTEPTPFDITSATCSADPETAAIGEEPACTVLAHEVIFPPSSPPAVVPEPATLSLVALGLTIGVAVSRRRRLKD